MNNIVQVHAGDENTNYGPYTGAPYKKTLNYLINECSKQFSDKVAIKFENRQLTYKTLYESANKLAKLLIDNDVHCGDIVGLAVGRSPEMVISLLAIIKSGAAYLPLDPEFPRDRIEFMLDDSSAKILLTSAQYAGHFQTQATVLRIEDAWAKLDEYDTDEPEINVTGDDLAYILYTSGSTGQPKGVMVRHYNLVNCLLSMQKKPGADSDDKILAISTISFDIAGLELYLPLICGAQMLLVSAQTAKDGCLLLETIKREQVTIMQATPYTYRMLLAAGWDERIPFTIISGGEALPKDLVSKLLPRCLSLWNQYGPTETTIYSTQKHIENADDITIGKPIDNTQIYILDEHLNTVEAGAAGEICIAGDGVAEGYLNRPELTAERFIDNPFSEKAGDKMYRTGDLGRFTPAGDIQCLGRIDHQVKVRGYRIELEEIEYALLTQPNVKEAVVTVRNDMPAEPRLTAYIVLRDVKADDEKLQIGHLQHELKKKLPAYMIPDDFVSMVSIAITPNGKIDRKALPKPGNGTPKDENTYAAARTPTEILVKRIWEQQMGIKNISITDNFFSLGGHSLVAIKIMAHLKKITGKQLSLATLFENSTIEKLSAKLDLDKSNNKWQSLVPIKPAGTNPPLYIIHGDGLNVLVFNKLATYLDNEQPVYGLQGIGLEGGECLPVMKDIAAKYVAEIIDQNPSGPYLLAGYSLGGYIAVEMRKQLIAMGKEVKMLMIFDTDAEKSEYQKWYYLLPKKIKRHLPNIFPYLKTKITKIKDVFNNNLYNSIQKRRWANTNGVTSAGFYARMKKIRRKYRIALNNYSLNQFDDTVHLYKATTCSHYVDDTAFLGWKKYAKRGVIRYEVPGDHLSMLNSPNVEKLAQVLQASINRSASDNKPII